MDSDIDGGNKFEMYFYSFPTLKLLKGVSFYGGFWEEFIGPSLLPSLGIFFWEEV